MLTQLNQEGLWPRGGTLLALPSGPSSWLFAASLAFAPLISLRVPGFVHVTYCDVLFVMAVVTGVAERFVVRDFVYKRHSLIAVLVYVFCVFTLSASYVINISSPVSIYWSAVHGLGYSQNFLVLVLNTALIPLAVFAIRMRSLSELRFIILVWTASALYDAVFVIAYCNGYISHYDWYWVVSGRAAGLAHQPNALGVYTVLALPGLLLFWCEVRGWILRALIVLGMVAIWKAVGYSGSRTSLGAFVIAVIVFMVMRSRDRILGVYVGGAALIVAQLLRKIIAAFPEGIERTSALGRLIFRSSTEHSNSVRDALNSTAYQQWADNPIFGVGYGMLRVAHNLYLQMLDVTGVVGFFGYMCAICMPLIFILINRANQFMRNEEAALFSATVTILATGWVQPSLADYNMSVVFGLTLYLAINPHFYPAGPGLAARQPNFSQSSSHFESVI